MLTVPYIRENKDKVLVGLQKRSFQDAEATLDKIIAADDNRRRIQRTLDDILAEGNRLSAEIGILMKTGKRDEAEALKIKTSSLKEQAKGLEAEGETVKKELNDLLIVVPNIPHESVPFGKTPEENEVFKAWEAALPEPQESWQPHWELMKKYDIIDLELGVKITGAGFPVYKGKGAKLQRALISFFLDEADNAGYQEIQPPLLINRESGMGTGQLPDKEGQMYYVTEDDLYLIPTAEVPVTNLYRDVLLEEKDFPIKLCAYTPCFRREAGSYGAHVRGLNRLHQFDKVEIVQLQNPAKSYDTLMTMVAHVESLLTKLELPFRILRLCGGDMGFNSALTFDFEVWSAAQQRWLEVSSVSNFETYQANRMQLRYKPEGSKKTELAHTLNGSALALARIVAALLENNQTPEGIRVPKVLQTYTRFDLIA